MMIVGGWAIGLAVTGLLVRAGRRRRQVRDRVFISVETEARLIRQDLDSAGPIDRWLTRAGYRSAAATSLLPTAQLVAIGAATAVVIGLTASGIVRYGAASLNALPGGVGDIFLPLIYGGPWLIGGVLLTTPRLAVCCDENG